MIYFVQRENTDIKIGTTEKIHQRLDQLIAQYGELKVLGLMLGGPTEERRLHSRFYIYRTEGMKKREWFYAAPAIEQFIAENAKIRLPDYESGIRLSIESSRMVYAFCYQHLLDTGENITANEAIELMVKQASPEAFKLVKAALEHPDAEALDLPDEE